MSDIETIEFQIQSSQTFQYKEMVTGSLLFTEGWGRQRFRDINPPHHEMLPDFFHLPIRVPDFFHPSPYIFWPTLCK